MMIANTGAHTGKCDDLSFAQQRMHPILVGPAERSIISEDLPCSSQQKIAAKYALPCSTPPACTQPVKSGKELLITTWVES
ncbi:hypothetical protein [Desulfogranum marinum]|uniref:hypothetical protein n=1 Tax=Desulfogranum marinum TaxID=453220 RepID=UPI001963F5B4|nr:hypothetical protein [Desulfogranum marinum]MBM9512802.1 hypothetical protein [Desulfogranum marinum]